MGTNPSECNKYLVVHRARIEQEFAKNFLDLLDARVVQERAVGRTSRILGFGTVVDFNMAMGKELTLGGNEMAMSKKEFANVILHR